MPMTFGPELSNYTDLRYKVILDLEESGQEQPRAYKDGKGFATIGAGFLVSSHVGEILRGMGYLNPTSAMINTIADAVSTLVPRQGGPVRVNKTFGSDLAVRSVLDAALRQALQAAGTPNQSAEFRFDRDSAGNAVDPIPRIRQTFEFIVPTYENLRVSAWLPNIPQSYERLALLSLAYNNVVGPGKSQQLRQAILDGNRAEAWFEIRYNSNSEGDHYIRTGQLLPNAVGLARRRFEEAALLGLYNPSADPFVTDPSIEEAKQIYRMLQVHRSDILDYEKAFGQLPIANMAVTHNRQNQGEEIAAAHTYPHLTGLRQPDWPAQHVASSRSSPPPPKTQSAPAPP